MTIKEVKRWEVDGRLFDNFEEARWWEKRGLIKNEIRAWLDELSFSPSSDDIKASICTVLENTAMDGSLRGLFQMIETVMTTEYPDARPPT